jgi:hypothetical protein
MRPKPGIGYQPHATPKSSGEVQTQAALNLPHYRLLHTRLLSELVPLGNRVQHLAQDYLCPAPFQ